MGRWTHHWNDTHHALPQGNWPVRDAWGNSISGVLACNVDTGLIWRVEFGKEPKSILTRAEPPLKISFTEPVTQEQLDRSVAWLNSLSAEEEAELIRTHFDDPVR